MHTLLAIMMVLMVITGVMNTIAIKWADLFQFDTDCGGGKCVNNEWVGDGKHLCAPEWSLDTICNLKHNGIKPDKLPVARFNHPFFEAQVCAPKNISQVPT